MYFLPGKKAVWILDTCKRKFPSINLLFASHSHMAGFIDIHHHFFCPELNADKSSVSAKAGWQTPEENLPWTPELSIKAMDSTGVQAAILSFPAFPAGEISTQNRAAARRRNDYVSGVYQKYPDRFGFFATLPFLDDVQGAVFTVTSVTSQVLV
jgi:predicted TIM-barrel fold metal-dependent hydrolase